MTKPSIPPTTGIPSDDLSSFTAALHKDYKLAVLRLPRKDAAVFAVAAAKGELKIPYNLPSKASRGIGAHMDRVHEEQAENAIAAANVWRNAIPSTAPRHSLTDRVGGKAAVSSTCDEVGRKAGCYSSQKMREIQHQVLKSYQDKRKHELRGAFLELFERQFIRYYREGGDKTACNTSDCDEGMLGCEHYARNCKLFAECCHIYVSCRLCHDEAVGEDHIMNRYQTRRVLCMSCLTEQTISAQCIACDVKFAAYYCDICKFFENTPGRDVYHCPHCGICRRGKGLGIDNFHCDKCDACVTMASKPQHKCQQGGLHASCPVCCEHLFTSTRPVVYMRCGHSMHGHCFTEYTRTSFACPLCFKSVTDMQTYFRRIDDHLAQENVNSKNVDTLAYIFCNDCEQKSTVPSQFLFHKCGAGCNSYNTRVIDSADVVSHQDSLSADRQSQP